MSDPKPATVKVVIERDGWDTINTYVPIGMTVAKMKSRSLSTFDRKATIYFKNCPENGNRRGVLDDFFEIHEPCILALHYD